MRSLLSLITTIVILISAPSLAQRVDLDELFQRIRRLSVAGDYETALVEARRFEAAVRARFGENHPNYSAALNATAIVYRRLGRFSESQDLHKRILAIRERGRDASAVAETLGNLAVINWALGRFAEAERLHKRVLEIEERTPNKADSRGISGLGTALSNLAVLYKDTGRYGEAEALYLRAHAITIRAFGEHHADAAIIPGELVEMYVKQGRLEEAEKLAKQAYAIREREDRDSPANFAQTVKNLAAVYHAQGKYRDAETQFIRALAIQERVLGASHAVVAETLNDLALVYKALGRYSDAEKLFQRALLIQQQIRGSSHPDIAENLYYLADLHAAAGNATTALDYSRKATAALLAHAGAETKTQQQGRIVGLVGQRSNYFTSLVAHLSRVAQDRIEPAPALAREGFEAAQWSVQSSAASAVQQMGLRLSAGSGTLAVLIRENQDLSAFWRDRDKALAAALGKPDAERDASTINNIRRQIAEAERKLAANAAKLEREFPDYAALASPKPLNAEDGQALLGANEALVFWLAGEKESYVFALTRDGFEWKTIPLGAQALAQKVANFRGGLDVDAVRRGLVRTDCTQVEAAKRGVSPAACGEALAKECEQAAERGLVRVECSPKPEEARKLFDLGVAHELYASLLGPVDALIKDKQHLLVVPSSALTALPFHLLVTDKPAVAVPSVKTVRDLATYRDAAWLLKRHAVTVLPSVASLKALRVFARKDGASKPLVGFGDPVFNPEDESKPAALGERVSTRSYAEFWQGVGADRTQLRKAVRLPETAAELQAVAKNLGAPASDIHLRVAASERTVKRLSLAEYRVVYFATHGLVAGEVKGLGEPSLLLTLPKEASETDDGLLTASEVAQLKLNADWVVLSACNTIAGDKPGAEALSGLARAFFYAGARALLVSHWAVDSNAATLLTTSTFDIIKADPKLGRAEALRRAMLAYMNNASTPRNAYPAYWAPFVVVGEGAAR